MNYGLDDDFALVVVVAEGCRRTALLLLEDAVEVADVVEAAAVANLRHAGVCIDKQAGCIAQANVDDIVGHGLAGASAEEAAESCRGHSCDVGKCLETNLFLEVLVDMLFNGPDTTALGLVLDVGK